MHSSCALIITFLTAAFLAGCATESESSSLPPLRIGMSREYLRSRYGEPLRIQPNRYGGEDWYYSFVSKDSPQFSATASEDHFEHSNSVSVSFSDSKTTQERAVHLSSDGHVTEPIPEGRIVEK